MRLLQHHSQARLQPVKTSLPVVHAINANTPRRWFVKTAEEFRDRALSATRFANKRDALSAANPEVEIRQHLPALRIRKCRPIKNDFPDSSFNRARIQI